MNTAHQMNINQSMNIIHQNLHNVDNVPVIFSDNQIASGEPNLFANIHWHSGLEIMLFKEGTLENIIDDKIVRENINDVVVINAKTLHSTRSVSKIAKYYGLVIDKELCIKYGFALSDYYIKSEINDTRITTLIEDIKREFENKSEHFEAMITAKILEILSILFRDYAFKKNKAFNNKNIEMVKQGIRYIRDNFANTITIDDVAKNAGYSKYHFCRIFKEITKSTISSYINMCRVNEARRLISEEGFSVGRAACECGFDDISYFTKIFKKYLGVLPSQIKSHEASLED